MATNSNAILVSLFEELHDEFLDQKCTNTWQKRALKLTKKSKQIASLEGGGVFEKSTWFLEGGRPKNHVCPQGGEGGSKMSENLSTWFMNDPLDAAYSS